MRSRVLLGVVAVLLAGCGDGGGGEPDSTTSSAAVISTTTAETPALKWSPSTFDEGIMVSVTQVGDGFAGLVYESLTEEGPIGGSIYRSTDGMVWEELEFPVGDGEMVSWVSGSSWGAVGLAITGETLDQIEIVLSDDGFDWHRVDPIEGIDLPPGGVAPISGGWGPGGVVMIYTTAVEADQPEQLLLFSENGEDWATVDVPEEAGYLRSILVADSGYVILEGLDEPGVPGFGGWFSEDGLSWQPVSIDDVILSGSGGSTGWREGFIVIRDVFDPEADTYGAMTWESADGMSWNETPVDPFESLLPSGYERSLQGSDLGLVMLAMSEHDHESDEPVEDVDQYLLFSPDAREWTRWNVVDTLGGSPGYYAIGQQAIVALVSDMDVANVADIHMTVWVAAPGR